MFTKLYAKFGLFCIIFTCDFLQASIGKYIEKIKNLIYNIINQKWGLKVVDYMAKKESKREFSFDFDKTKNIDDITFEDIIDCWSPNRRYFDELINAANSNNLIPFIGAGITSNLSNGGFPSWNKLILKLARMEKTGENEIKKINSYIKKGDYENAAQILEDISGSNLLQRDLRELFSPQKLDNDKIFDSVLMILPKLHPQIILTTNYDSAIERAYFLNQNIDDCVDEDEIKVRERQAINVLTPCTTTREFVGLIKNRSTEDISRPSLYKFHGDVQDNGNTHDLILSKKSYDTVYGEIKEIDDNKMSKDVVKNLYLFLFAKTILFLGCSLEEDRIMKLIRKNTEVEHYAFVGCGNKDQKKFSNAEANKEAIKRSKKLNEMNIHAIFYPRYARNCVKILLENLSETNISLNVSSMYPKKSSWMNNFLKRLKEIGVKKYIVIFGGIITDLRKKDSNNLKLLNSWLNDNSEANVYFCYDTENAAQHRINQIENEITKDKSEKKIAEIQCIPNQFSSEVRNRVKIVPMLYDLNGYAVLADNKLFWNFLTHERSSDTPVVELDLHNDNNKKFINYMKYALEQSKAMIEMRISDINQKLSELNDPVLGDKDNSKDKISYIEEMLSILDTNFK